MKRSISIIGSAGIPARYGGFETLAEQLAINLKLYSVTVYCTYKLYPKNERTKRWHNAGRVFLPLKANGISSIFYDLISLVHASYNSDTILILGGSSTFVLPLLKILRPEVKFVFHPDGIEWQRPKWNQIIRLYLLVSIKIGCRFAHKIIVDNHALTPNYSKYKKKIKQIAYGGDHIKHGNYHNKTTQKQWLTISRAEADNGLVEIAEAFKKNTRTKWILVSNFHSTKYGRALLKNYKACSNIVFIEATYSKENISKLIDECFGYIHGNNFGGTNPSLVMAMFFQKPILIKNNPFNKSTTNHLGYFYANEPELAKLLERETSFFNTKVINDLNDYAFQNYKWEKILNKYIALFEEL